MKDKETTEEALVETPGKRIQRFRVAKGLSEATLAGVVGVGEGAIKKAEAAPRMTNYPRLDNALKIARALGVTAWEIAFGEAEPQSSALGVRAGESRPQEGEQDLAALADQAREFLRRFDRLEKVRGRSQPQTSKGHGRSPKRGRGSA